ADEHFAAAPAAGGTASVQDRDGPAADPDAGRSARRTRRRVIVTPLAMDSPRAVRDALLRAGWDEPRAEAAAAGLGPSAVRVSGLDAATLEALVKLIARVGLDILTGDDWALVAGPYSRLGALARPWMLPPELAEVSFKIGVALASEPVTEWTTARGVVSLDRPFLVGILNLTPDSFSDGGKYTDPAAALSHASKLLAAGADMLDLGGESTRPGRPESVSEAEECRRVLPVLEGLIKAYPQVLISVDTVKSAVARAALDAGAAVVNDVSAFRLDAAMARVVAGKGAGAILMHSRGTVQTMATFDDADYQGDVVRVVASELSASLEAATTAGVSADRIVLDPGFGFAKTGEQNLALLDGLEALCSLGRPILVGPSRKRFLGMVTGREVADRDAATAASCVMAWERGARLFRVHDVATCRDALAVAAAASGRKPA
ncbi:MAG TPA: dihydropteroate synthase, partial [Gemmatimonadales bacterium]|nr:dihydropteroate synthase [Gemmatimonadales bacterium]